MYRRPAFDPTEERRTLVLRPAQRARLQTIGRIEGAETITCGGARHRLSVRDGDLHTDDHDIAAELALHALGGELPECLVYVCIWRQSFSDGFLRFWAEHEHLDPLERAHLRREWVDNYWEGWPPEPPAGVVVFDQAWQDALGAAVARRRASPSAMTPALRAAQRAVQVRLRSAFVRSLAGVVAHTRPDALVPLRVAVGAGAPAVSGRLARTGSAVEVRVDSNWLWDIWATGRAVVGGRLAIGRDPAAGTLWCVEWRPTGGPAREHAPTLTKVRP